MLGDAAGEESLTLKYGILCLNQKENDGGWIGSRGWSGWVSVGCCGGGGGA